MSEQNLILIRGIPGAGKSTFARILTKHPNAVWFEADMWRGFGEARRYSEEYSHNAHAWCLGKAADALRNGRAIVVVSNTFAKVAQMRPYYDVVQELIQLYGHTISITVLHVEHDKTLNRSVHGDGVMYDDYINSWEEFDGF